MKILKRGLLYASIGLIVILITTNYWVILHTRGFVYSDINKIPKNRVGLVLGTSSHTSDGGPNPFFESRILTCAELFKLGKISNIIVSGDNRSKYYNEPLEMKKALIKMNIPDSLIVMDYGGWRTINSMLRAKLVFNIDSITVISQLFHTYRAVFIGQYYNMKIVAMATKEPESGYSFKMSLREFLARPKAILDLYVLEIKLPNYLNKRSTKQ